MALRTPGQRLFSFPPPLYAVVEALLILGSLVLATALLADLKHGLFPSSPTALAATRSSEESDLALPDEDACALDAAEVSNQQNDAAGTQQRAHRRHRHRHRGARSVTTDIPAPSPSTPSTL